jgi:uncharacterized protein (DUF2267 family)
MYPYLALILAQSGPLNERLNTQTQPIHWAAFLLDPISALRALDLAGQECAKHWILERVKNKKAVSCSIQDFLGRKNGFTKSHISNLHIDDPVRYWTSYFNSKDHDGLARFAVRLFQTVVNSVASERAFSAMRLIISKLRNRLSPEKANKLIFIYMSQRVLDQAGDLLLEDWVEKEDEKQVELKELLLSVEQEDQEQYENDDIELDVERQESQI